MPEVHLRHPRFANSTCGTFTKNKQKYKKLKKHEIYDIFLKTNKTKPAFSMIWLMDDLKNYLEDQLLIKCFLIKYLMFLKIQSMVDATFDLLPRFTSFLLEESYF